MKLSKTRKLIAALSAAVIAVSALTAPVHAIVDPLTGKEYKGQYGVDYTRDPITKHLYKLPQAKNDGMNLVNGVMVVKDDSGVRPYTGKATVKGNTRYYDNGVLWTGWRKLGGKWYYFDPDNSGNMALGKVKTATGVYYLDEKGAWNGTFSKGTKMPDNFAFIVRESSYGSSFELNSSKKMLTKGEWEETDITRKIDISKTDLQIFYDTIMSCGLNEMDRNMTGKTIAKELKVRKYAESTDVTSYHITVRAGDENFNVDANYYTYSFCGRSENADNIAKFLIFTDRYAEGLPEYKELTK